MKNELNRLSGGLIAGAGPVGLAAGLFLARAGIGARVVEIAKTRSVYSKALAVNPRTLALLEESGVTARILEKGLRIHGARMWRRGKVVAELKVDRVSTRYPFMIALSQAATERLLEGALKEAGGRVEYGVGLTECQEADRGVNVELTDVAGNAESIRCSWLLAADGAHSRVREAMGVKFEGRSFDRKWYLADVPLATTLDPAWAHAFFLDGGGFLFLIRVVDDALEGGSGDPLWRVMGNRPDYMEHLVDARVSGEPVWTSSFHVAHRIDDRLSVGNVYFAGDAAHIHSPMGARGMNLGIEDAWVFANCMKTGRMEAYGKLRRPVDLAVVKRVELLSRIVSGESAITRFMRASVLPRAVKLPWLGKRFMVTIAGLDHEVGG